MSNPVVHFEVAGKDGGALVSFYEQLLGWKTQEAGEGYWLVEKEDGGIGGGIAQSPSGSSHVTFYIQVDDLQATLDKVESLGGATVVPVTSVPKMVTFASFADPEGHVVGIVSAEVPD